MFNALWILACYLHERGRYKIVGGAHAAHFSREEDEVPLRPLVASVMYGFGRLKGY